MLIVEDSIPDTELLVRELERSIGEFTWQRVSTLVDVGLALSNDPDLILCDIMMPGLDGREVISLARSQVPNAGIIVVTGELDDREAAAAVAGGADDYLLKDRLGRLGGAIERILAQRWQQRRTNALIEGQDRILKGIAMGMPLEHTLEAIVRLVEAQSDDLLCSILRVEDGVLRHAAAPSLPDEWNRAVDGMPIGPKAGSCGTAAWRGEPVIVTDIATDPLWEDARDEALAFGFHACWSQPIFATNRKVLGTLAMYYDEPRAPSLEERHNVEVGVGLAAVAMEKAVTDASLDATQKRVRTLFESNPKPVFLLHPDGTIAEANPAGEALLGTKSSRLQIYRFDHFLAPDDYDRAWNAFRASMSGVSDTLEVKALRLDRSEVLLRASTIPIRVGGKTQGMYVVCEDITGMRALEERYRLAGRVLDNIAEGIMIFDRELNLTSVNPAFESILGWGYEEVRGDIPDFLDIEGSDGARAKDIRDALAEKGVWQGEIRWQRKNGERFPALVSFSQVLDEGGQLTHHVGVFTDISASHDYERRLAFLSRHDVLTQLANRDQFQERLAATLVTARQDKHGAAVVFLDLDNFKTVNDSLGHEAGDSLLRSVAERLRECVGEGDLLARFGGDDFGVILARADGPGDGIAFMERLMKALSTPFLIDDHQIYATFSAGVSLFPQDGTSGPALMSNADIAMYRAKDQGRNTYQFFSQEMNVRSLDNLLIANNLRTALERDELEVHYQPRYDINTGKVAGTEALVRWRHPERGMVPPGEFIPVAESIGLIGAIGEWVLEQACRQAVEWRAQGHEHLHMAVNLSPRQLVEGDIVRRVQEILDRTGMRAEKLDLEITESMLMSDFAYTSTVLSRLHDLGTRLAIDDFGTGYSSLSYLKRFTIDDLKIDRSFVMGLPGDEDDAAIVRAIVAVAKSLGMRTVAEGVETEAQIDFLRALECDEVQGFLFSPPRPPGELVLS